MPARGATPVPMEHGHAAAAGAASEGGQPDDEEQQEGGASSALGKETGNWNAGQRMRLAEVMASAEVQELILDDARTAIQQ